MDNKDIAELIKELIGKQSQRAFAEKAGVKDMSLSRWLNGTKINLVDFDKLCKAAGRKIHEVLNVEGVTASLQKDFDVPEEYTLSVKELLKELLELQQENYVNGQSDNFIKLMTRHIRETKETLRATKIRPDRWLSITDFNDKITENSELKLIIPPDTFKENVNSYSVIFQLTVNSKTYFCSYATKGGGTTWTYLRGTAYRIMANKLALSSIKGVIPSPTDWQKLLNKQYEDGSVEGQIINYEDKNKTLNTFIDLVTGYFKENNYSE